MANVGRTGAVRGVAPTSGVGALAKQVGALAAKLADLIKQLNIVMNHCAELLAQQQAHLAAMPADAGALAAWEAKRSNRQRQIQGCQQKIKQLQQQITTASAQMDSLQSRIPSEIAKARR